MKNIRICFLLFIIISATSCTYIYYPTHPILPETRDENKNLGVQGTLGLTKAQLAAWYAIDTNLYITGTFAGALSLMGDADTTTGSNPYHALSTNIGAGYKIPLSDNLDFDLQGGCGFGKGFFNTAVFNITDSSGNARPFDASDVATTSIRGYLQPAFAFNFEKSTVCIIPRFTYESFNRVEPKGNSVFGSNPFLKPRSFLIIELFMMTRFKTKAVNIELYAGVAANLTPLSSGKNNVPNDLGFVAQPLILGLGLSKTFGL